MARVTLHRHGKRYSRKVHIEASSHPPACGWVSPAHHPYSISVTDNAGELVSHSVSFELSVDEARHVRDALARMLADHDPETQPHTAKGTQPK